EPKRGARGNVQVDHRGQSQRDAAGDTRREHDGAQRFAPSGRGPHVALARASCTTSALAEGRALLNRCAQLGTIRPAAFILQSLTPATSLLASHSATLFAPGGAPSRDA